jgi:hypothetical protein
MVYAKVKDGKVEKVGNLYKLLPNVSNPSKLSEDKLKEMGVYKVVNDTTKLSAWQKVKFISYNFDGENINEVKEIEDIGLNDFKNKKLEEIKQTYYTLTNEGFECSNGIKLDCRESDKVNWKQLLEDTQSTGDDLTLRDYYNQNYTLSPAEIESMMLELQSYYRKLLADKWSCEDLIDGFTTYEEVRDFYWRKAIYDENDEFVEWEYNSLVSEGNSQVV